MSRKNTRRPWTLRTRLVVYAVTLIAVVAAVIGSVTAIAFQSYMDGKLDGQLRDIAMAVARQPGNGKVTPGGPERDEPLDFIGMGGGQPFNTFGAVVSDGSVTESKVVKKGGPEARESTEALTDSQQNALDAAGVPWTAKPMTSSSPGSADTACRPSRRATVRPSSSAFPRPRWTRPSPP